MFQLNNHPNTALQQKALALAALVESFQAQDLNEDPAPTHNSPIERIRQSSADFLPPSSDQGIGDNLLSHAALSTIKDPSSVCNLLALLRYSDPEKSYDNREEISRRLRLLSLTENLEFQRFRSIYNSNLYQRGLFTIEAIPLPVLFLPFSSFINSDEIVGVRGISKGGEPALTVIFKEYGRYNDSCFTAPGSLSSSGDVNWALKAFETMSIREQLAEAGFIQDDSSPQIFRRREQQPNLLDNKDPEIIAIVYGNKIRGIFRKAPDHIQRRVNENTRVIEFTEKSDDKKASLTLTNDRMEFKVDDEGHILFRSQYLFRELTLDELDITPLSIKEETSGFNINGINNSSVIQALQSLNGISINELEYRMRPMRSSDIGFLDRSQSLIDLLVADNEYILGLGLSHQELAIPLRYAMTIDNHNYAQEFEFKGNVFNITSIGCMGRQDSPFEDGTFTHRDYTLTNLRTGKAISFSGLVPMMIERYGFYEGNTEHRVEPSDIIQIFGLLSA